MWNTGDGYRKICKTLNCGNNLIRDTLKEHTDLVTRIITKRTKKAGVGRSGSTSSMNTSNQGNSPTLATSLSPELANIKTIMEQFNTDKRTPVRFREIAEYLDKMGKLNIVAEGITQSLKHLNNTKLLQYIKPIQDLSETLPEENLQEESLRSMSSLQQLNYLMKWKGNNSDKSELHGTQKSKSVLLLEQEGDQKPST